MSVDSRKENQNMGNPEKPEIQGVVTPPVEEKFRAFLTGEERILNDIAGGAGFTFKRGDGWAINPETGEATYDPKFFEEKGYTPSQALFGAFHEIKCHLVETSELLGTPRGQEAHERLKDRIKVKPRLHIWENCRTDVKGNLAITRFAPSLAEDVEAVYREKLWPETDLTSKPKHLQFMYSILRTAMVPDEEVTVDPKVKEAISKLRNVKGKDVIALATDPAQDPLLALRLSERYIEPVIEELYQEDVEEKENEIAQAMQVRDRYEDKVLEIQTLINFSDYFMEHLEDLLLGGPNPLQNAALSGLLFDETPTYQELINGTPKLACLFKLNDDYKASKTIDVSPERFERSTQSLKGFCSTIELRSQNFPFVVN